MKYRILLLIIPLIIVAVILLALGSGFLVTFVTDKFGETFLWAGLAILAIFALINEIKDNIKSKKELTKKRAQYLEAGKLLFKNHPDDFEAFYGPYLQGGKDSNLKKLKPIEVLHKFAHEKGLSLIIDWRGEENEGEIQHFISAQMEQTIRWANTATLKTQRNDDEVSNGAFIVRLFKAMDKDLQEAGKKLLFFELESDAYVFMVTDKTTFREIKKIAGEAFYGTEKLKTE